MNKEDILGSITTKILPSNCNFSPQQKKAILADGSIDVVAGPGAGKTTALIAKCALLMMQNFNNNKGVCLITHTNVAVDEINTGIRKIGFDVEYPNFVGTIQEFFNVFFAKKAFHLVQGDKQFRVLDDDEYQLKFEEVFNNIKPKAYSYNPPNVSRRSPFICIQDDCAYEIQSNAPRFYKKAFNESVKRLFDWGIVTNKQCLQLSKWYIERFGIKLQEAVAARFNYVLLDEAQDTSSLQYELLNKVFPNNIIPFQKFGDPYQALYNLFEGNFDVWKPIQENAHNYKEISETSRFGTSIANVVQNVCIEKYDNFKSLDIVRSFKPHYIIYKDENELYTKYSSLIKSCEIISEKFKKSKRKDAILSTFHKDLTKVSSNYVKPSIKPKKNNSPVTQIYNFLVGLLSKEIDEPFNEMKEVINSNLQCKIIVSRCIKEFVSEGYESCEVKQGLEETLGIISDEDNKKFKKINVMEQLDSYRLSFLSDNNMSENKEESEFYIGTIHSAKGETHRSTLLLLNTISIVYIDNVPFEYSTLSLLKEYLIGNYIDPQSIKDDVERDETIKALKLAYVALSRPTHLMVIGIPENKLSGNEDFVEKLDESGWKEYNVVKTEDKLF